MNKLTCRICGTEITHSVMDLGLSPIANAYISQEKLEKGEMFFPLHAYICKECFLVQLGVFEKPENIFKDYAYFSSYSNSWLEHCKEYCEDMYERFELDENSKIIEIASNDGYLLQYFKSYGSQVLGIEPAENVAQVARLKGINTKCEFFGQECAKKIIDENNKADLVVANNVLAHVPDLNDLITGIKMILKPDGIFTAEFPHLMKLINNNQFDTIYHEHFSYFSFLTMSYLLEKYELMIFDVDELLTHGGSLRIYATHKEKNVEISDKVKSLSEKEKLLGMNQLDFYNKFTQDVFRLKMDILQELINIRAKGKSIIAYGAPAKGNTMLNFCGIGTEIIEYTVDLNPHKQGNYLPGSRIPIYSPDKIMETKPDYIIILPWNLKDEIKEQLVFVHEWGCKFITVIPEVNIG